MASRRPTRFALLLALVLVATAVAGAGIWLLNADGEAAQPHSDDARDRLGALDSVAATRETVVDRNGDSRRTLERVSLRPGDGALNATVVAGPRRTDVRVSNGSVLWLYNESEGTAWLLDDYDGETTSLDRIPRLLEQFDRRDDEGGGAPDIVVPFPVIPTWGPDQEVTGPVGDGAGPYSLSFDGTDAVDGRTAYVLRIEGEAGRSRSVANYTQTLWLDAEWYFPLKHRTAWTQGGDRTVLTTTHTNVTFNPDLPDGTFVFDPPPGVEVEMAQTPNQERFDTVAQLREAAEVSVPQPTLPGSFALEAATRTTGRIDSVGLQYVNATSSLSVAKLNTVIPPETEGEPVTVAGQSATIHDLGPRQAVIWECNGYQYKVRGSGLPRSFLIEVAESIGCS